MNKLSIFLLVSIFLISCARKNDSYTIKGNVIGVDTGMIILQKYETDQWVKIDSTRIENGKFTFKGTTALPEMWYLTIKEKQVFVPLFVENSMIDVEVIADSIDKVNIKGSISHDIYKRYQELNKSLDLRIAEVYKEWKKAKEIKDSVMIRKTYSISTVLD